MRQTCGQKLRDHRSQLGEVALIFEDLSEAAVSADILEKAVEGLSVLAGGLELAGLETAREPLEHLGVFLNFTENFAGASLELQVQLRARGSFD